MSELKPMDDKRLGVDHKLVAAQLAQDLARLLYERPPCSTPANKLRLDVAIQLIEDSLVTTYSSLTARIAELEGEVKRWKLTLHGLTPGGSEYANDPKECEKFVRHQYDTGHQAKKDRVLLGRRLSTLEKAAGKVRKLAVDATSNLNVDPPDKTATLVEIDLTLAALLAEKDGKG